ncbi:MAG: molybdopterin dinucleotide binding domain-containing protein [Wenzhouxiangella sp.]
MFAGDGLVRRSRPLQQTRHAESPRVRLHPATAQRLGLDAARRVRVHQGDGAAEFELVIDADIAVDALWLPSSLPEVAALGPACGPVTVEAVAQ